MKRAAAGVILAGFASILLSVSAAPAAEDRSRAFTRAQVWMPTKVASMDIRTGPRGPGAFPFRAEIACEYLNEELGGASPKFACVAEGDDELKVKYGGANGEVYAEVAATRLLWALGFGADRMYSVRIICRGCPEKLGGILRANGERIFDPVAVERKMPGKEIADAWSWADLDLIDEEAGGAPRAHRDALKLLAVFIQHTDSKPQQQRLICLDEDRPKAQLAACRQPFALMQDVGVTFGRANRFNDNATGSMNLAGWSSTPVWRPGVEGCVGNLPKSMTGTLDYPVISEEGRAFLSNLLQQLSDQQLRDLFEISRVTLRVREPANARSGFPSVDEWVAAFKRKRAEIAARHCA